MMKKEKARTSSLDFFRANSARHERRRTPSNCHHTLYHRRSEAICDRALMPREASHAQRSDANASLLSHVRKRSIKHTLPCQYVRKYREGSSINTKINGSLRTFPDRVVDTCEYILPHHAELQARSECSLGRKAQAQLHAQQQLGRELKVGRISTEVWAAPSESRSRRSAV